MACRSIQSMLGTNKGARSRMDAKEFFTSTVVPNYEEAVADPSNWRKLWNAALSMNTVQEYLALHRAGYATLTREEVDTRVEAIRNEYPELKALHSWAVTLKHVRKHRGQVASASSTAISPQDPNSFAGVKDVVDRTFATLSSISEFK